MALLREGYYGWQVNRLERDTGGLRAEINRLATIVAERQPLVDRLRDTVDDLREVSTVKMLLPV